MKKIFLATLVAAAALMTSCNNGTPKANLKTDIDTLSYEMGMVMSASEGDFQNMLTQQGSDSAYVDEFLKGYIDGMKSADDKKKMAYNLGLQAGMQLKAQMPMIEKQVFQADSTKKVSLKNFVAGFTSLAKNKTTLKIGGKLVDKEEANKRIMDYMFGSKKQESIAYMQKIAKTPGIKAIGKGVYAKVIEEGTSTQHPTATSKVTIKYEGRLTNGQVFDASTSQPEGQVQLSLANVIKGWQVAVPQMTIGSTWEIYIPYELGYGEQGAGPIPPFSALIFKITLVAAE